MFSSVNKLRKKKDFDNVYKKGRIVFGPVFNIRFVKNDLGFPRFAFVISKKTAKLSVKRNLVKRRLRSAVLQLSHYKDNFDIVINIKVGIFQVNYEGIVKELEKLLPKK